MEPKVSIIVPIYNIKNYVERCVKSLLNQTYRNIEIILVNDGSTDGTEKIIKKYECTERIVLINKINGGLSDARNTGVARATGDYILYVDGDDFLDNNSVELLVGEMDPSTDVVLFPYSKEYAGHSQKCDLFEKKELVFNRDEVRRKIYARMIGPEKSIVPINPVTMDRLNTAWGKLYRRHAIEGIRFTDTKMIGPEDCWYNIQIFNGVKKAKYTSKVYYRYEKENTTSLLHGYNEGLLEKRWRMYNLIDEFKDTGLYNINLSNRIICEQYGLISNIINSDLDKEDKKKEIKKLLTDSRYQKHYKETQLSDYSFPWPTFYKMCKYKNIMGINMFFALLRLGGR